MTMMKARKTRTTRTTRTRTTVKAIAMAKLTPNLNVSKSYGGRAVRAAMCVRRGEIEALEEKRKRFNNIRVRGKRLRGGGVDVTMLSQPRRARHGIVGCLTQESICFRGLVHKIQSETGVPGASGVQQLLEAYSTMGRAFAGGPPKLDEPFVGEEGVSELQLRHLNDMEMLIAFQIRLCVDMGCVIASGAASPAELCQDVQGVMGASLLLHLVRLHRGIDHFCRIQGHVPGAIFSMTTTALPVARRRQGGTTANSGVSVSN